MVTNYAHLGRISGLVRRDGEADDDFYARIADAAERRAANAESGAAGADLRERLAGGWSPAPGDHPQNSHQPDDLRERLARVISDTAGDGWAVPWEETCDSNKALARKAADAILAELRRTGDDPETLRRERDEAQAEVERLTKWGSMVLEAIGETAGFDPVWAAEGQDATQVVQALGEISADRDTLAAKLAAAISMIETLGEDYGLEDVSDQRAIAKLRDIDLPARAAAMLRVVEEAEHWDRCRTKRESKRAEAADTLIDAVRRYRQATSRDTYGRALDGEAAP